MIAYLTGTVHQIMAESIIVLTASGVGYLVYVPQNQLGRFKREQSTLLYVHTHVREGEVTLYGFQKWETKSLFEMLIKTSGVGPKLGLAVLSHLSEESLVNAVHHGDEKLLGTVPGIGKKMAAKLCLDLADRLKKMPVATDTESSYANRSEADELISALVNMGYAEKQVIPVVRQLNQNGGSFEEQFKEALKQLSTHR